MNTTSSKKTAATAAAADAAYAAAADAAYAANADTLRTVAFIRAARYFIIDTNGALVTRNEFGKALRWTFSQFGPAASAARRAGGRVYDRRFAVVYPDGAR